jgi:ribosomal protein S18 acetylase RimI-like enzyme
MNKKMKITYISESENSREFPHPFLLEYRKKLPRMDLINLEPRAGLVLLHEDLEIIAAMSFFSHEKKEIIQIIDFKTQQNLQRNGYGSQLMDFFLERIRNERKDVQLVCVESNEVGRKFFTKFHFKPLNDDILELKFNDFPHFLE